MAVVTWVVYAESARCTVMRGIAVGYGSGDWRSIGDHRRDDRELPVFSAFVHGDGPCARWGQASRGSEILTGQFIAGY